MSEGGHDARGAGPGGDRGLGPGGGPDPRPADALSVEFRVRFDEAGPDGRARSSALLRYAQECAWIHSEAVGLGREWYAARGLTWVVRCIELTVHGAAPSGTRVLGTTRVIGFRRVWGRRQTEIRTPGAELLATVSSDWVMIDQRRSQPTRVPDDFSRAFGVAPSRYEPHRVALPPTPASAVAASFSVRPHELDPLAHANHAVYLDWLEETLAAEPEWAPLLGLVPRTYRLEYAAPATMGLELVARAWGYNEVGQPTGIAYRLEGGGRDLLRAIAFAGLARGEPAPGAGAS